MGGTWEDGLIFVGKNVASGALNRIGSDIGGHIMAQIFGGPGEEIMEELNFISQQLTGIQNSINNLDHHLDAMEKRIQAELQKIEQQQLYQAWLTKDNDVQLTIAQIDTQYGRVVEYATSPKTVSKDQITKLSLEILDTNTGAEVNLKKLNALVLGSGQNKGVLQLWAEMMLPLITQCKIDYGQAIDNYFNYYTQIAFAQIRAANLLVEAYNQQKDVGNAKTSWNKYRALMTSQEAPFIINIDKFIYYALQENVTWNSVKGPSGMKHYYTYSYFKGRMSYYAGACYKAYYRPTYEHATAEKILAYAQALAADERRIVVWMIYPSLNHQYKAIAVKDARIQLLNAANPQGTAIDAAKIDLISLSQDVSSCVSKDHYIKRFIFSTGIGDGTYIMKEINGRDGLDPLEGTAQQKAYFQGDQYLAYNLNVTPGNQFDFMDFAAYYDVGDYAIIM